MVEYKISLERLKKAGISPEVGKTLSLRLKDKLVILVTITKVEEEFVMVKTKQ